MELNETLFRVIYAENDSIKAYWFIDGMIFMAKSYNHISMEKFQELVKINNSLYEENKYDQPGYGE